MDDRLGTAKNRQRIGLLYHYCRLQRPGIRLSCAGLDDHLQRTFMLYRSKAAGATWESYLTGLYAVDWYLAVGCLERDRQAWQYLFAARAGRTDSLLVDALRARAVRLYPHNEERQESAVAEFWGQLLTADNSAATPILARYDGQRPLVPWLIRVFQNAHVSRLRQQSGTQPLPDDEIALPVPPQANGQWHEAFCLAAREAFQQLTDAEWLLLGLRLRYRLSQREVARLLGLHEGNVSRQIARMRDKFLEAITRRLRDQGWTGDDLSGYVLTEMGSLLLDEPHLSADHLARLLAARRKRLAAKAD